ncbi:MAG: division/cell wall cluster transcriptional repressor MraZ [Bacteroidota bacterium]
MTQFIGDHICKLDAKGRLLLPSAIKKQLSPDDSDRFVIKKDIYEKCLILYTMGEWERQNKLIRERLNPYNKEHNRFLREFFKGTAEVALDASNRILVPKRLLDLIDADKELVLAGQFDKIEIWSRKAYDAIGDNQDEFAGLADKILGGNQKTAE